MTSAPKIRVPVRLELAERTSSGPLHVTRDLMRIARLEGLVELSEAVEADLADEEGAARFVPTAFAHSAADSRAPRPKR